MTKQYRLRLANEGDVGKLCIFTNYEYLIACGAEKVSKLYGLLDQDKKFASINGDYEYAYVIEEMPQIGEPCEFEYGEEIEVKDNEDDQWKKRIFIMKAGNYKQFCALDNETNVAEGWMFARKLQQPTHYDGQILTDEKTGKRFELREIKS